MPPKTSPSKESLEELSELRARLAEAEHELERATRRSNEEPPEGVKEFIAAVSKVDLPAFWEADPVLWFRQCESAFRRSGTVSSGVKFDHVVCKLPNAVSLSCRSLLLAINPEDKDGYERLKAHLCKAYGKTKWQLGYALLDAPGIGDRRPSQLLQDLRALLPAGEPEGTIFQCVFLKRLSGSMSAAIMAADLDDVDAMAAMADRLHDQPSAVSAVTSVTPPCCSHVSAIDSQQRRSNRSGRPQDRSSRSPERRQATPGRRQPANKKMSGSGSSTTSGSFREFRDANCPQHLWVPGARSGWCNLHKFYGNRANYCNLPCSFSEN